MGDLDADVLMPVMTRVRPTAKAVHDVRRLSGGASMESWVFAVESDESAIETFVLRRAQQAGHDGPEPMMAIPLATEAELIRQAHAHGVAVPEVIVELQPEDNLGTGFVMGHVAGETIPQRILRDPDMARARDRLAGQCGEALAKIHSIRTSGLAVDPPLDMVDGPKTIANLEAQLNEFGHASPIFSAALTWLETQATTCDTPVLVHGDFRHGNLMIGSDGLAAVLDWELAHLGDPMEDLGWLCAPSWRFGTMDRAVGGFGDRPQLFEAYEAASGVAVDADRVTFWEAVATLKWGIICLLMYTSFETGQNPSIERAAIGQKISETEIDLIDMMFGLGPASPSGETAAQATTSGSIIVTESPTAEELLTGVERFLRDEAMPELAGRSAFMARVAANAVATVRREISQGPTAAESEKRRLAQLLAKVDAGEEQGSADRLIDRRRQLCHAIRTGSIPLDDADLVEHLRATVLATIAIDQPRYGTFTRQRE